MNLEDTKVTPCCGAIHLIFAWIIFVEFHAFWINVSNQLITQLHCELIELLLAPTKKTFQQLFWPNKTYVSDQTNISLVKFSFFWRYRNCFHCLALLTNTGLFVTMDCKWPMSSKFCHYLFIKPTLIQTCSTHCMQWMIHEFAFDSCFFAQVFHNSYQGIDTNRYIKVLICRSVQFLWV